MRLKHQQCLAPVRSGIQKNGKSNCVLVLVHGQYSHYVLVIRDEIDNPCGRAQKTPREEYLEAM